MKYKTNKDYFKRQLSAHWQAGDACFNACIFTVGGIRTKDFAR